MEEAKEDVRADIAVMRRAAEKADTEVTKAELEKKKQVWYSLINIGRDNTSKPSLFYRECSLSVLP